MGRATELLEQATNPHARQLLDECELAMGASFANRRHAELNDVIEWERRRLVARLPDYEAAVEALERLVHRTPFVPAAGGITVTLTWEQVREQQAALARLRDKEPANA